VKLLPIAIAIAGCAGSPGLLADGSVFDNGTWRPGLALESPRGGHSATLLPDGTIVVLGGESATSTVSAQRCDTSGCTEDGALLAFFERHDAVLLPTGKILVEGGTWPSASELYDPVTGEAHELPGGIMGYRLVPLRDGRVLAVGGVSAMIFDSTTETWSPGPALTNDSEPFGAAVALADGRVLAVQTCYGCATTAAEIFDPRANSWTPTDRTVAPHQSPTLTLLRDGRVLLVGGGAGDVPVGAELFDPTTDTWKIAGDLSQNRMGHAASLLLDGRVLVTGGRIRSLSADRQHPTYALFDPTSETWTTGDELPWRQYHPSLVTGDGSVLVLGGDTGYLDSHTE
jgi:hypothetical protein